MTFLESGIPSIYGSPQSGKEIFLGWWYHSEYDTIDKADPEKFEMFLKAYLSVVLRLSSEPVLPYNFAKTAEVILNELKSLNEKLGGKDNGVLKLEALLKKAEEFKSKAERLMELSTKLENPETAKKLNDYLIKLARVTVPINHSTTLYKGKYDYMGTRYKPVNILQEINELVEMDPSDGRYHALLTKLLRARNRVSDALTSAIEIADEALEKLGQ